MTDDKDTLILVTADHSHTLSIAGHPSLDSNVLGMWPLNNLKKLAEKEIVK